MGYSSCRVCWATLGKSHILGPVSASVSWVSVSKQSPIFSVCQVDATKTHSPLWTVVWTAKQTQDVIPKFIIPLSLWRDRSAPVAFQESADWAPGLGHRGSGTVERRVLDEALLNSKTVKSTEVTLKLL